MRRISTLVEIVLAATLLILGLYITSYEWSPNNKLANDGVALIGGAFCFTLGSIVLIPAVRSVIWHWQMLRQSAPSRHLDKAASHSNHT
jgi:hypothetical protein